jgi:hypothetical protein
LCILQKVPHAKLGTVTEGQVIIDNESWSEIIFWKERYDTAIEKFLIDYLPE